MAGGRRAYGWTADDSAIVPNEAAELRRIAREVDPARSQPKSMKQVVRELNDRHVPTSSGGTWTVTSLSRTLRNPRMIGYKADSRGRINGAPKFPPIFATPEDVALWRRVRSELSSTGRGGQSKTALLANRLACGVCEGPMVPSWPRERLPRYACHVATGCGRMSIQAHLADDAVAHAVVARAGEVVDGITEISAAAWWENASTEDRRALVQGLLSKATIHPKKAGGAVADRITYAWSDMPAWPPTLRPAV